MTTANRSSSEAGFGLVEIVVAMFLLSIVLLVLVPVLATGMQTAADNKLVARASQLVNWNIQDAQNYNGGAPSCASLASLESAPQAPVTSASGPPLQVHFTGTCADSGVAVSAGTLVHVRVSVTEVGKTKVLADADSTIFVRS